MSNYIGLLNVNELNLDSLVTNTLTVLQSETASLIQATDSSIVIESNNTLYKITVDDTGVDIIGNLDMNGYDIFNVGDITGPTGGTGGDLFINGDIFVTGDVFVNDGIFGGSGTFNDMYTGGLTGNTGYFNYLTCLDGDINGSTGHFDYLTANDAVINSLTGNTGHFNYLSAGDLSLDHLQLQSLGVTGNITCGGTGIFNDLYVQSNLDAPFPAFSNLAQLPDRQTDIFTVTIDKL